MSRALALIAALAALAPAGCARPKAPTPYVACALATVQVTAARGQPTSHAAECEATQDSSVPRGYYVVALRAYCHEAMCGSTLMGYFAVEKTSGKVFHWDFANERVGAPVGPS